MEIERKIILTSIKNDITVKMIIGIVVIHAAIFQRIEYRNLRLVRAAIQLPR